MKDIQHIAEVFQNLAKLLVSNPESLTLTVVAGEKDVYTFQVSVGGDDIGKLIGRVGRTAHSIRTLLRALSMQHGLTIRFDIVRKA